MSGGLALLERAITYTLGGLHLVTPATLSGPTPCGQWDVQELLWHLDDSLTALQEAVELERVGLLPEGGGSQGGASADPVVLLRDRACRLLGAWTSAGEGEAVSVGECSLSTEVVLSVGALEVAVHGWDVARACGADRPIPASLAGRLLDLAPLFVTDADRPARFAAPVVAAPYADPGERLLAFLGRRTTPIPGSR